MKRILMAVGIIALSTTMAFADWLVDFNENYRNKNIDFAVENAMKEGVQPDEIVKSGLELENLNPANLVKALYCAGATGEEIYNASQKYNISDQIRTAGFRKSKEECSDQVAEIQPYTPGGRQGRGFGGPNRGQRGRPFASPSTF